MYSTLLGHNNYGNHVVLPQYIDDFIHKELGAFYCKKNRDMVVLNWDKKDIQSYLGTYFPRSYAESYCIFSKFFSSYKENYSSHEEISMFDFGCGTGGQTLGLLTAIKEYLPNIRKIVVNALDGNMHALRMLENLADVFEKENNINVDLKPIPFVIEDFYDMSVVTETVNRQFDFIITFKAICEFVTMQQFETKNPYEHFVNEFCPKIKPNGILCIADVTTYNNVSQEWLPKMIDNAFTACRMELLMSNTGYNESFYVSHTNIHTDLSKIAWRISKKTDI